MVPEGTYVKEGDFLVRLDDSALQTDLLQQQIACNTSGSLVVDAQADLEAAKLALNEYESGPFRQESQTLESEEFVAKENVRRAEEYVRYSEKLVARGYATEVQLEADRFAVEKARKELEVVRTKLDILQRITKKKTLTQLQAAVVTSEARLRSREATAKLDQQRLANIQDYIEKCLIKAPTSGQVVYANDGQTATGEPLIAEGKTIRERQIIFRLPDPKRMRVLTRVNEARIDLVRKGMKARIAVDAFPGVPLYGIVQTVSEYPLPSAVPYSTIKEYAAEVEILTPPQDLRTGMTAKVSIEATTLETAMQVPLQAVIEREARFFCFLPAAGGEVEAREVELGPANDAMVVIKNGLAADEHVFLAPQNYEKQVTLPAANPARGQQVAGI
ncbi:MAG: HlyD family efflux transporter periplasmic adaptor subunit [Verrucomicrobiaceae bacterium]|nr:MAG: HlyD family efflux transporter periplasmic adaptor subunit [Verrucomicrobiaceae bacterium]